MNVVFIINCLLIFAFCLLLLLYSRSNSTSSTRQYFDLYQRPSLEEACSVLLPVLGTVVMQRGKKSVIYVAQCVAALVPVHAEHSATH